jgi:hypothetical protein
VLHAALIQAIDQTPHYFEALTAVYALILPTILLVPNHLIAMAGAKPEFEFVADESPEPRRSSSSLMSVFWQILLQKSVERGHEA